MTDRDDDDRLLADPHLAELRAWPTAPPSRALSTRVLARALAALAEAPPPPGRRLAPSLAVGSAVVAAIAIYLTWAVDFLVRLVAA